MPTIYYQVLLLVGALMCGWCAPRIDGGDWKTFTGFFIGVVFPTVLALISHVFLSVSVFNILLVPLGYAFGAASGWALEAYTIRRLDYPETPFGSGRLRFKGLFGQLKPLSRVLLISILLLTLTSIPALSLPESKSPPSPELPCVAAGVVVSLAPLPAPAPQTPEMDTLATRIVVAIRQNNLPALAGLLGDLLRLGAVYGDGAVDATTGNIKESVDLAMSIAKELIDMSRGKSDSELRAEIKVLMEWKAREMEAADSAAALRKTFRPAPVAVAYFELDSSSLVTSANAIAAEVANRYRDSRRSILLVGSTDRTGQSGHNFTLAGKRALSIQTALVAYGVRHQRIHLRVRSEAGLPVSTSGGVTEPENRRVDVFVR